MTPILVNGRKPRASHSLLHGCCQLHAAGLCQLSREEQRWIQRRAGRGAETLEQCL